MGYKRQLWTSGYEYRVVCPHCGTYLSYKDSQLGFRSWHPNGFVFCPGCNAVIKHNEYYAVNPDGTPVYKNMAEANMALRIGYQKAMGIALQQSTVAAPQGAPVPAQGASPVPQTAPVPAQGASPMPQVTPVPAQGASPVPQTAPAPVAPVADDKEAVLEAAEEFAVCSNCGAKYVEGKDRFCSNCGNKLQ